MLVIPTVMPEDLSRVCSLVRNLMQDSGSLSRRLNPPSLVIQLGRFVMLTIRRIYAIMNGSLGTGVNTREDHVMLEKVCDLWNEPADAKCITTNGYIKTNGALVMGAGVAGQAQERYPMLPKHWGSWIQKSGNHVRDVRIADFNNPQYEDETLIAFPVKHNWFEKAEITLIARSAKELMELIDDRGWKKILLPRPGCGNGQLKWEDVKAVIEPILDDRVVVIDNSLESMLAEDSPEADGLYDDQEVSKHGGW